MNYKAGDMVVCVDAKQILYPTGLVAGKEYLVQFTDGDCTAVEGVYVTEEQLHGHMICAACGTFNPDGLAHFFPSRFIKLDPLKEAERVETSEPVAV